MASMSQAMTATDAFERAHLSELSLVVSETTLKLRSEGWSNHQAAAAATACACTHMRFKLIN